jgi:hypothetical protein
VEPRRTEFAAQATGAAASNLPLSEEPGSARLHCLFISRRWATAARESWTHSQRRASDIYFCSSPKTRRYGMPDAVRTRSPATRAHCRCVQFETNPRWHGSKPKAPRFTRKFDDPMAVATEASNGKCLPTVKVAERYGRTPRTIERWLDDEKLNFPQPVYINRFKYWNLDELETWERKQAATSVRSSEGHPAPKKCITPAGRAAT